MAGKRHSPIYVAFDRCPVNGRVSAYHVGMENGSPPMTETQDGVTRAVLHVRLALGGVKWAARNAKKEYKGAESVFKKLVADSQVGLSSGVWNPENRIRPTSATKNGI